MPLKRPAPHPDYFTSIDEGDFWEMRCKVCGKRWWLTKPTDGSTPGSLQLLNHAYSHLPDDDEEDDE